MQKLVKFGTDFTKMIMNISKNTFWKDVLLQLRTMVDAQKGKNVNEQIGYDPGARFTKGRKS